MKIDAYNYPNLPKGSYSLKALFLLPLDGYCHGLTVHVCTIAKRFEHLALTDASFLSLSDTPKCSDDL